MIGIVVALPEELDGILPVLGDKIHEMGDEPFLQYSGIITGVNNSKYRTVQIVVSGIGKVRAASATQYLISRYGCLDHIYNIGTCGATFQAILSDNTPVIDAVIESDFDTRAIDGDDCEKNVVKLIDWQPGKDLKILHTADHFTTLAEEDGYYDMEGYAVAKTCELNNIPCTLIKSVTDVINSGAQTDQYHDNIESACNRAGQKLREIIEAL